MDYEIPLLSGKDSMYVDGHLKGRYGQTLKISALETMQFSASAVVKDISRCVSLDAKMEGDRVYVIGETADELGGSEYYALMNRVGLQVPKVNASHAVPRYRALAKAIEMGIVASVHGIYRGGLGVHLAMVSMAGCLGMKVNLADVLWAGDEGRKRDDRILFSETPGRFIVTVAPENRSVFEKLFSGMALKQVGAVLSENEPLTVTGTDGKTILSLSVGAMKTAWKKRFGDVI
jgi:phosphoribosylformylglycinamidine synthase